MKLKRKKFVYFKDILPFIEKKINTHLPWCYFEADRYGKVNYIDQDLRFYNGDCIEVIEVYTDNDNILHRNSFTHVVIK